MNFEIKNIHISKLCLNTGQIKDVPKNPRFIKDERFAKIKQSLIDDPEMMNLRELIVYPCLNSNSERFIEDLGMSLLKLQGKFIVIGGNMRLKAGKELKYTDMPCKVLPANTPPEKLRAYAIKDNIAYGRDNVNLLKTEWNNEELEIWGIDIEFDLSDNSLKKGEFENAKYINSENKKELQSICNDEIKIEQFEKKPQYPITLVVTENDYNEWLLFKEQIKEENNFKAFMRLFSKLKKDKKVKIKT